LRCPRNAPSWRRRCRRRRTSSSILVSSALEWREMSEPVDGPGIPSATRLSPKPAGRLPAARSSNAQRLDPAAPMLLRVAQILARVLRGLAADLLSIRKILIKLPHRLGLAFEREHHF